MTRTPYHRASILNSHPQTLIPVNPPAPNEDSCNKSEPFGALTVLMDKPGRETGKTTKPMKTVKSICILLLLAGAAMPGAGEESFRTDINPALLYYQAFALAPEPMSQADQDYLGTKDGHRWKLPERYGKIVAGYDNQFKLVRQAARSTVPCDWGIDMSAGPATLLPGLGRVKAVAVAARTRVRWELQHDQQQEARDDLLATLALARKASRDGPLIATLVQMAVEAITCNIVTENFGGFSPETLKQLADGFEAAPARGTVAGCIPLEKAMCLDWLVRKIQDAQKANPGDDAKAMASLRALFEEMNVQEPSPPKVSTDTNSVQTGFWERLAQAASGTSQGVLKLVQDLDSMQQKLAVITTLPYGDFENQIKGLTAEIQESPNPLVAALAPPWENCRRREFRNLVYLAMIRAAVEYKLHGDAGLLSVPDPCGQGPFLLRRFVFQGVDRGFQLTSAIAAADSKSAIFVEKDGDPFQVNGPHVGEAYK